MRPTRRLPALVVAAAVATALACGDVPTLSNGIAYITGVVSPALAVAAGDTLRDSNGNVAPLRVYAFGRASENDTLPDVPVRFLVTSFDTGLKIDGTTGIVTASDAIRAVSIVGQVNGALQTPVFTLQVVPQPDSLALTVAHDSIHADTIVGGLLSDSLIANVTGVRGGARVAAPFIVVQYDITRVAKAGVAVATDTLIALVDERQRFLPTSPRSALDTTDASGLAVRRVRVVTDAFDTVYVQVTAKDLAGRRLKGSPALHVLVRGFASNTP